MVGPSDIGSLRGTPVLFEFGPNELPIGFYGTYTDSGITSLGFLTHDPDCVRYVPPAPEPEPEPEIWVPEPEPDPIVVIEEETDPTPIVLGILIPLILIGAGVAGFLLWRRRKRRQQSGDLGTIAPTGSGTDKGSKAEVELKNGKA